MKYTVFVNCILNVYSEHKTESKYHQFQKENVNNSIWMLRLYLSCSDLIVK